MESFVAICCLFSIFVSYDG